MKKIATIITLITAFAAFSLTGADNTQPAKDLKTSDILHITSTDQFDKAVNDNTVCLIDFYADWCPPCKRLTPIIEEISKEYAGKVKIIKINVDNNQDLAGKYGVRGIPAVFILKDGNKINEIVGLRSKSDYQNALDNALASK